MSHILFPYIIIILFSVILDPQYVCLACFLIPICVLIVIFAIIALVIVLILSYLFWNKRDKKLSPPSKQETPKKQKVKPQDSVCLTDPYVEVSPIGYEIKDTVV